MLVKFNPNTDKEVSLEFDSVREMFQQKDIKMSLCINHYDLSPDQSMVDYCQDILGDNYYIDVIEVYDNSITEETPALIFRTTKYHKIDSCMTYFSSIDEPDTHLTPNTKIGQLLFKQDEDN